MAHEVFPAPAHHEIKGSSSFSPGLRLKVFGALQIVNALGPVKVSGRAATLLTYLALEEKPLHRSNAAQLLWPGGGVQALRSLRVELTALRRRGIELSPNRSPVLRLEARTELDDLAAMLSVNARAGLAATLGRPLLDFQDHGNAALATWARRQRQRLSHAAQSRPPHTPQEPASVHDHPGTGVGVTASDTSQGASTRSALSAAAPGALADLKLVDWLATRVLPDFQAFVKPASLRPQLMLYVGRPGSGRRESLERLLPQLGLTQVEVTAGPSLDSLLTALEMNLVARLGEHVSPTNTPILSRTALMMMHAGPLALVLRDAERLGSESVRAIDFLMGLSHSLLVIAVTTPAGQPALERLLGHHDQPGWFHVIHAPALTPESLDGTVMAQDTDSRFETIRQTEGFLAAIRSQLPTSTAGRGRLNQDLKRTLSAEVAVALGDDMASFQLLALLPGAFTEAIAQGTLGQDGLTHRQVRALIRHALQAGILERVDRVMTVQLPDMDLRLPDAAPLFSFRSELQRAALAGLLDADVRQNFKRRLCVVPVTAQPSGPEVRLAPATSAPGLGGASRSCQLPGGYLLLTREDGWTVMRLGAADHAVPRLELNFTSAAPARRWQLHLRLQRLAGRPEDSGVHLLNSANATHRSAHLETQPWSQPLNEGAWMQAAGELDGRPLCLSVQASDIILHLGRPQFS